MINSDLSVVNGERVKGFVRIELYDKYGNKKVDKENLIVPGGKTLMFHMSAANILINGGNLWGLTVKQGVHLAGTRAANQSYYKATYKNAALTNILCNLTDAQKTAFSSETNFVNFYSEDFGSVDKVIGYANMELYPVENGKIGVPDYAKGADIVGRTVDSVRFKYKDGVGTGTINALCMAPYPVTQSPYGVSCSTEEYAPGYRIAKCLDRVNILDTNFTSITTKYTPPGVTGVTTDEEIITNYTINGIGWHKINLVTGDVTDITGTNTLYGICTKNTCDFKVIDDYVYILNWVSSSSNREIFTLEVYKISSATLVKSLSISSLYARFGKLLYLNGILYVTFGAYSDSSSVILNKLKKGSLDYFNAIDTTATTYAGILTAPSGIDERYLSFGHYGNNYIMYVSRALSGANSMYCTGYIFTDLANITGSIIDCIPSLRYTDVPFGNTSVSGVLSIGICREKNQSFDNIYSSQLYNDVSNSTLSLSEQGMFYSPNKAWSNVVSMVILEGNDIIVKNETDVLFITWGYKIV